MNNPFARVYEQLPQTSPYHIENAQKLDTAIKNLYERTKQSPTRFAEKKAICDLITSYVSHPDFLENETIQAAQIKILKVVMFGSFLTELAAADSDVDICVAVIGKGRHRHTFLQAIYDDFRNQTPIYRKFFQSKNVRVINYVDGATVPIVKLMIDGIPIDISCSISTQPPSIYFAAKLINAYCQFDPRLPKLVFFIKNWLKLVAGTFNSTRLFPNSYATTLMIIHCLQRHKVLPNLYRIHNDMFNPKIKRNWDSVVYNDSFKSPLSATEIERLKRDVPPNHSTVFQLFVLFLRHYADRQVLYNNRLQMSKANLVPKNWLRYQEIQIDDPFDTKNPGRSVISTEEICIVFEIALNAISNPERRDLFNELMKISSKSVTQVRQRWSVNNAVWCVSQQQQQQTQQGFQVSNMQPRPTLRQPLTQASYYGLTSPAPSMQQPQQQQPIQPYYQQRQQYYHLF